MTKNKYPAEEADESFVGKYEPEVKSDMVTLVFKENRTFELKVGRNVYTFAGQEAKQVQRSVIDHPDFTPEIKNYFVIR